MGERTWWPRPAINLLFVFGPHIIPISDYNFGQTGSVSANLGAELSIVQREKGGKKGDAWPRFWLIASLAPSKSKKMPE
jgi:hypothetical protein